MAHHHDPQPHLAADSAGLLQRAIHFIISPRAPRGCVPLLLNEKVADGPRMDIDTRNLGVSGESMARAYIRPAHKRWRRPNSWEGLYATVQTPAPYHLQAAVKQATSPAQT